MSPTLTPILIGLGALLVGWVIGFFDSNLRSSKKVKAAETRAEIAIKEAQDKLAEAEARAAQIPATVPADMPNDETILRLKKEEGNLVLELDGQKVSTPNLSVADKKRLIGLLTLMRPWLESDSSQPAVSRPAAPIPPAAPMPAAGMVQTPAAPAPAVGAAESKADPKKPAPPQSIVEQIDSILQAHMVNTPLARMNIRLHESTEGGVEVLVGLQKFSTVDDVPDPAIKSAIRAAIKEWEEKYTPS